MHETKGKRDTLEKKAAEDIREAINNALEEKESVVLAIPGGTSVSGIFNCLLDEQIPWTKVHIFMVDERLVTIDDEQSNFRLAKENLIDELIALGKITEENIHPFVLDESAEGFGIKAYEEELKKFGGEYDIVLLSSGEDGHIGALYPEHHSIEDESNFFIWMDDSPKPPAERMSMSKKLLLRAKSVVLLFFGKGKREAYEKFKNEKIDFMKCPAKLTLSIKDSYVFTDLK